MSTKYQLAENVWGSKAYLKAAHQGSLDIKHPGMILLKKINRKEKKILDLGCGEGTRLDYLVVPGQKGAFGVDLSKEAVLTAKGKNKNIKFLVGDLEKLPFKDNSFDLVYSAFVLEHLQNPEKVLEEAVRVVRGGGFLVFIAPNYGSPNRASPPFQGSRIKKLLMGFLSDFISFFQKKDRLGWNKVKPITGIYNYESDRDVTVEPYIRSLISYLKYLGVKVEMVMTCWEYELPSASIFQRLSKFLGSLHFYPFYFWGPHLVILVKKVTD